MPPWGNGDCRRLETAKGRVESCVYRTNMHTAYMHTYAIHYTAIHPLLLPLYLNLSRRARFIAI
jgi:hypothetical protein